MREFPPSRLQRRCTDGSDMLISVISAGVASLSSTTIFPALRGGPRVPPRSAMRTGEKIIAEPCRSVTVPWAAQDGFACGIPLEGACLP